MLNFIQDELFGWPILSEDIKYKRISPLDKMAKMRLFDTNFIFDLMIYPSPKDPSSSQIRVMFYLKINKLIIDLAESTLLVFQ